MCVVAVLSNALIVSFLCTIEDIRLGKIKYPQILLLYSVNLIQYTCSQNYEGKHLEETNMYIIYYSQKFEEQILCIPNPALGLLLLVSYYWAHFFWCPTAGHWPPLSPSMPLFYAIYDFVEENLG